MSLSSALNIINSAFVANAAQSAVISSNISNASTKGYAREVANIVTTGSGGVEVTSIGREANAALLDQVNTSTSQAAYQQALSDGLTTLANTVSDSSSATSTSGATANGASPSAMLANLQSALETYDASPTSTSAAQGVVTASDDLAQSLNTGAAAVQSVRETADSDMASAVKSINSLLTQFTSVNATIMSGTASGADVSSAQDTRDSILTQLSQQIGISTVSNPDGSTSIYTDSGVTLFQGGIPRTVSFTTSATLTDGTTGNAVMVDGMPITGSSSPMAIQSGALAGLANLRDVVAPQYGAQLDQIANGLINAFAESDQTGGGAATMPGLFTFAGATGVPSSAATTGLASEIEVNANVDPSQGGDVNLSARRRHRRPDQFRLHLQHDRRSQLHRPHRAADRRHDKRPVVQRDGGARNVVERQRLRQRLGELAAEPAPAGEQPARLPELRGQPGDDGGLERDRRQPRHRNDQHAEHRELLHDDSQAADDRQCDVHVSGQRRVIPMTASIVSTYSLGAATLSSMTRAQNQLTQLTAESSSGQYADLGVQLGDRSGYELSLRNQINQLQTLTTSNNLTSTSLKSAQAALDAIRTTAQSAVKTLTSTVAGSSSAAATLQSTGTNALQSLIAATNTTADGQYVFGGDNSGVAPMADYFSSTTSAAKSAIDTAFFNTFGFTPSSASAASITATDMQNFISGTLDPLFSGSNWTSNWSSASSTDVTTQIAPGESATTSVDANQPGFQQLAEGYAMLAEFGGSTLSSATQQTVVTSASSLINQGITSLTTTEATLGLVQTNVTNATTSMSNQLTILQTQVGNLDNVDASAVAVQLNALSVQLQTAYQLTAQLQKMNLAQYLPA